MKISTRLRYNAAASIILVCLLFVLLLSFSQSMKAEIAKFNYANELLHKTSTLIVLTHEYLIKHEQRSGQQWQYQFENIMKVIEAHEETDALTQVRENLEILQRHYDRLTAEIQARRVLDLVDASEEEISRFRFSERLLSDQMQICSQRILAHAFKMTGETAHKLTTLRMQSNFAVLCFGAIMILITVLNALATLKRIALPLTDLVTQVKLLEKVDFSKGAYEGEKWDVIYKDDEVGKLWMAFGDMKTRLAKAFGKINRELKERKAAEAEVRERNVQLKQLQDMLESIINSMPSMLVGIDDEGKITHWNTQAQRQTGLTRTQAEGRHLSSLIPALSPWVEKIPKAVQAGQPIKEEKTPLDISGNTIHADITLFPLVSGSLKGAVIRVDDVSERVAMDEIIIQSEKMLSVGGLAAGVAHEINNPLAGILQNMQVVVNRLSPDFPKNQAIARECQTNMEAINAYLEARNLRHLFDLISDSGERASAIIDNMLSFSRMGHTHPDWQSLPQLMDKTLELASSDYDLKKKYDFRKIYIVKEYDNSLPKILCEGGKIQQVIFNLLKNAAQAMANGHGQDTPPRITLRLYSDAHMANIEVEDNGPGVPENIRTKIFEPFFTTKEVGEGTGLGLFVAYFIVTNNHHGSMRVESSPGKGTRFIVRLPLHQPGSYSLPQKR